MLARLFKWAKRWIYLNGVTLTGVTLTGVIQHFCQSQIL